jgi:hypothetical protein
MNPHVGALDVVHQAQASNLGHSRCKGDGAAEVIDFGVLLRVGDLVHLLSRLAAPVPSLWPVAVWMTLFLQSPVSLRSPAKNLE